MQNDHKKCTEFDAGYWRHLVKSVLSCKEILSCNIPFNKSINKLKPLDTVGSSVPHTRSSREHISHGLRAAEGRASMLSTHYQLLENFRERCSQLKLTHQNLRNDDVQRMYQNVFSVLNSIHKSFGSRNLRLRIPSLESHLVLKSKWNNF